jgi:hypothetical protein
MISCPTCGAQNDPNNRFCDQCGTRLDAVQASTPPPDLAPQHSAAPVGADEPTVAALNCPTCGATVLPGEAFCDNCGADLTMLSTPPVVAGSVRADADDDGAAGRASPAPGADAPTMMAPPPPPAVEEPPAAPAGADAPTMMAPPPARRRRRSRRPRLRALMRRQ